MFPFPFPASQYPPTPASEINSKSLTRRTKAPSARLDRTTEEVRRSKIARLDGASDITGVIDNSESPITSQSNLYQAVGELLSRIDAVAGVIGLLSEASSNPSDSHKQFAEVA